VATCAADNGLSAIASNRTSGNRATANIRDV
jgi:hypothetical protein